MNSIQEIINVYSFKAEQLGVNIHYKISNFDYNTIPKLNTELDQICTDN